MRPDVIEILRTYSGEKLKYCNDGTHEFLETPVGTKYPVAGDIICFIDNILLTGNNRNYQKMYDRISWFYDIGTQLYSRLKSGSEKDRLMQYLSLLEINNGDKVIEISIGTGRNIKYLNHNADYYGVDISLGMLKQCLKKLKRLNREITLIQAEAESLPIKEESFDAVFSAGGFNFFNDPGKAVSEMLRIAKPGVKILITDETEKFRVKHSKNEFYKNIQIKDPTEYLPDYCKNVGYKEICDGDLYVFTFQKP